jgi:hypothetical protein
MSPSGTALMLTVPETEPSPSVVAAGRLTNKVAVSWSFTGKSEEPVV